MQNSLMIFGLSALLLTGCGESTTPTIIEGAEVIESTNVEIESGDTSPQLEKEVTKDVEVIIEEVEDAELTQAQALLLSYEEAVAVRDLVQELYEQMDTKAQEALDEPLAAFSADIETLKYFVDLADREPLLDDDHIVILEITARIEEALAFFAHIVDLVL